jgi:hypothetical protein
MTAPGTYTGADGREYRVQMDSGNDAFEVQVWLPGLKEWRDTFLRVSDIPAAKAALDALVEQESGEWVEWKEHGTGNTFRIKRDGSGQIERVCKNLNNGTTDVTYPCSMVTYAEDAYRKGREVALEETSALRDAARELVRMALTPAFLQDRKWFESLVAAAQTLEGKL